MKKIFTILCTLFLASFSIFATPELENGTVISLSDFSEKFKDNIILINYSSLNEIDIDFNIYRDSNWVNIGKINGCPFGNEVRLITKEKFKNINYIGYKCNLPKDKIIIPDIRHHDLMLYIVESSNIFFGKANDYNSIKESPSNGIYKFDTTEQRRDYEDNVKVQNAPKCIIMFKSPDYGTWDVYATASGNNVNNYYQDDVDDYSPYWIIQVLEEHKYYTISAFSERDDLNFSFQETNFIEENNSDTQSEEAQLQKLKQLFDKGIIDEDEYKAARLKVLGL